jgi:hypothetical protein
MENDARKEEALKVFENLMARLDSLDGMYCWLDETELVRSYLENSESSRN